MKKLLVGAFVAGTLMSAGMPAFAAGPIPVAGRPTLQPTNPSAPPRTTPPPPRSPR